MRLVCFWVEKSTQVKGTYEQYDPRNFNVGIDARIEPKILVVVKHCHGVEEMRKKGRRENREETGAVGKKGRRKEIKKNGRSKARERREEREERNMIEKGKTKDGEGKREEERWGREEER